MKYIVADSRFFPATSDLRDTIQEISGERILITHRPAGRDIILRVGAADITGARWFSKVNSNQLVNLCQNKVRFVNSLPENTYSVKFTKGHHPTESQYPVIIRTTVTSFGGRGIVVARNRQEFDNANGISYWWSPFIQFEAEYRFHVLGGKLIKAMKKLYIGEGPEKEFPIRSHKRCYKFAMRYVTPERYNEVKVELSKFWEMHNIGHGYFGLDCGYYQGHYYWIEGNSAPGFGGNSATLNLYANYLINEAHILDVRR